jgi:hypothetical protein
VAEVAGKVAGCVALSTKCCGNCLCNRGSTKGLICSLFVAVEHRRKGLASALLRRLVLDKGDQQHLYFDTENDSLVPLICGLGFVQLETQNRKDSKYPMEWNNQKYDAYGDAYGDAYLKFFERLSGKQAPGTSVVTTLGQALASGTTGGWDGVDQSDDGHDSDGDSGLPRLGELHVHSGLPASHPPTQLASHPSYHNALGSMAMYTDAVFLCGTRCRRVIGRS